MEKLWLANLDPAVADDDIRALVGRYAPDIELAGIQRVEGDGSRPAVLLTFTGKKIDSLGKLKLRLDGLFWKGRRLSCSTTVL